MALFLAWCLAFAPAARAEPAEPAGAMHNVLMLYSNGRLLPANIEFDRALHEVFGARPELRVDVFAEFLDAPKFGGEAHGRTMAGYLADKYAAQPPRVIIAGSDEALDFMLRHRQRLFPQVPVVHMGVVASRLRSIGPLPDDVIGVPVEYDFLRTVEQALRWHPQARRLVIVTGDGARDWEARLRTEAAGLEGKVTLEFLAGLPTDALQRRLGQLGPESVVYTPGFFSDGAGRKTVPRDAARLIAAASGAPVYGPFPTFIGTGVVGGYMPSYAAMGQLAAHSVADLLSGTPPGAIVLPKAMPVMLQLDWRQARRWDIAAQAVPAEATVFFKEPSFWEAYWHVVLIAGAVMLMQTGLIAALLIERRLRRRTAAALAQSEQRMSLAAEAARLSMWIWDLGRKEGWLRSPARRATDRPTGPFIDFNEVLQNIHAQDRDRVQHAVTQALATGEEIEVEYRLPGPDGEPRWVAALGRADRSGGQRLLGVALDITQRKRAEAQAESDRAALRHMTRVSLLGQLSASIAHQLNQPLASILSNAEAAQKMLARDPVDLAELREICNDIVAEDHRAAEVIRRLGVLFKRGEPLLVPLDLNELVRDTLDLTRTNLLTRHVTPMTRLAEDLAPIDGDRVQLQQLLLNLIVNAADAMGAVPEAVRELGISTALRGGEVEVHVHDHGPGIAATDLDNVFDPFWSTKSGGMGIGLAICRSIAEAHRGSLSARNAAGGGAVFCLRLPVRALP